MRLGAFKRFLSQDAADAPDWFKRKYLDSANEFRAQVIQALHGNLSIADNTNCWVEEIDLSHGIESGSIRLKRPILGVQPIGGFTLSNGQKTNTPQAVESLSWRPTGPDNVKLTAAFGPPTQYIDLRKSANQSMANGSSVAATWDVVADQIGTGITVASSSRITVSIAGVYELAATVAWATNATGRRHAYIIKNGINAGTGDRWAQQQVDGDASIAPRVSIAAPVVLAAGDYVEVMSRQDSGGARDILGNAAVECAFQASLLALSTGAISARVACLFIGA